MKRFPGHFKRAGLLLATLLLATLLLANRAVAITTVLSGFEGGPQWTSTWTGAPYPLSYSAAMTPSYFNPIEGSAYLTSLTYTALSSVRLPTLTLLSGSFTNPFPASGNVLSLCYGTQDGGIYAVAITITASTGNYALYPLPLPATSFPSGGASTDWHMLVVSLNYLRNLGLDTTGINSIIIDNTGTSSLFSAIHISYDRLVVDDTASSFIPNVPNSPVTVLTNCGNSIVLNMPPVVTTGGANAVEGFHIYRAPAAGTPFTSVGYVATSSTTFSDTSVLAGSSYWYIAMPFDTVAPSLPPQGVYVTCQKDLPGQAYFSSGGGPNEDLVSSNSAARAVSVLAQSAGTINAPTGLTGTGCSAPEIDLQWTASSITPTGSCNYIVSYTVMFSANPGFATYDTKDVPSTSWQELPAYSGTVGLIAGTTYYYKVRANDEFGTASAYGSTIAVAAVGLVCGPPPPPPFTPTATPTSTITPVSTSTPVPGKAQIYPNPFHPDRGECFRVGAVPANTQMKIYDMIGALVYSRTLGGTTACVDNWDGNNNNGQKVVTGLYQILLTYTDGTNTIYRIAVIRGN